MNRRTFIKNTGAFGVSSIVLPLKTHSLFSKSNLNVLVLGGTNFVGPAVVNSLIADGHKVTIFNRGITNPHLFPELNKVRGDRTKGIRGYENLHADQSHWDAVIDVWPQNPHMVDEAIGVLKNKADHYLFISSIAVYRNYKSIGINENYPLRRGDTYEEGNYNVNKVLCERVVQKHFPDNHTILRPGSIVGERDPGPFSVDLINRMINRSEIVAADSNDPVQFIDVKDLANFITLCAKNKTTGQFNIIGPGSTLGYRDMLRQVKTVLKSNTKIYWMEPDFLIKEMELEPFMDIPFWIPLEADPDPGFYQISHEKAVQNGLQFSDFENTVKSARDSFINKTFIYEENPFGISNERENEIIELWKKRIKN